MDYCHCGEQADSRCTACLQPLCFVHKRGSSIAIDAHKQAAPTVRKAIGEAFGGRITCEPCGMALAERAAACVRRAPTEVLAELPSRWLDRAVLILRSPDLGEKERDEAYARLVRVPSIADAADDWLARRFKPECTVTAKPGLRTKEIPAWCFRGVRASTYTSTFYPMDGGAISETCQRSTWLGTDGRFYGRREGDDDPWDLRTVSDIDLPRLIRSMGAVAVAYANRS